MEDEDWSAGCRTVMSMAFSGVGTKVTGVGIAAGCRGGV